MATMKIRISMANNSDARKADVLNSIPGARGRHNGGKVVIVTLDAAHVPLAEKLLLADNRVSQFSDAEPV